MNRINFGDVLYIKGRIGWQALSKDEYLSNGDYYLVTGVDITDTHRINFNNCYYVSKERYDMDDKIQLKVGDIIVTKDGTIGKIGIIDKLDKPATLNSHLFLIRNKFPNILDTDYLFQILRSHQFQKFAQNNTHGSNIPAFTQENISSFEIDLPPLQEQHKIAKILKNLDEKIIINHEVNTELESMAKTLYDYWFLQFEFPNEEGKPYKSSGGKMVYSEQLKREIPEDWEIVELGSQIFENNKSTIKVNDVENIGKIPFFTSGEEILNCSEKMVSGLNIYMSTGGNASIKIYFGDAAYSTDTWCINAGVNTLFYYEYLMTIKHQINDNYFDGSGLKHLKKDAFKKILLYIPKIDIVEKFNQIVEKYFQLISQKTLENKDLTELRDFLLPLLMNGQVTFKDKDEKENQPIILNYMDKFNRWKETQGYAARGDVDDEILKKIYDAMDEDDKK